MTWPRKGVIRFCNVAVWIILWILYHPRFFAIGRQGIN